MKTLIFLVLIFSCSFAIAQSTNAPKVQFFHQLFMNDTIQSVEKVVYADDNCDVQFKLSDDKTDIYLMDYDGKRSIKIYYTTKAGEPKDMQKPHCQVQDMRVEL